MLRTNSSENMLSLHSDCHSGGWTRTSDLLIRLPESGALPSELPRNCLHKTVRKYAPDYSVLTVVAPMGCVSTHREMGVFFKFPSLSATALPHARSPQMLSRLSSATWPLCGKLAAQARTWAIHLAAFLARLLNFRFDLRTSPGFQCRMPRARCDSASHSSPPFICSR